MNVIFKFLDHLHTIIQKLDSKLMIQKIVWKNMSNDVVFIWQGDKGDRGSRGQPGSLGPVGAMGAKVRECTLYETHLIFPVTYFSCPIINKGTNTLIFKGKIKQIMKYWLMFKHF